MLGGLLVAATHTTTAQTLVATWVSSDPTSMAPITLASAGSNSRGQTFYASTGGANAINALSNDFSVVAWINPTDTTELQGIFSANNTYPNSQGWYLATNGSALRFTKLGIVDIDTGTGALTAGVVQKISVTVSSTAGVSFYVNDQFVFTSASTTNVVPTTNGIAVGSVYSNYTADYGFLGSIQEVSVYNGIIAIPEPSTYAALIGLGALGFVALRRRRTPAL